MTDSEFISRMAQTLKELMDHILDMNAQLETTCSKFETALVRYEHRKAVEELDRPYEP